jgi:hypothetical protein
MNRKFQDLELTNPEGIESIAMELILKSVKLFIDEEIANNEKSIDEDTYDIFSKILKIYPELTSRRLKIKNYRISMDRLLKDKRD